jgi:drug/metabolite transporter (DMT)-like permease
LSTYAGEVAGLLTSVCWSFSSIFFTFSGRQVGSPVVNRTRLLLALAIVSGAHWVAQGQLLPVRADLSRWGWMGLSGLIGFVIGDACLFQAFVMIGPRLAMLLMALNPVMGAVLAWALLHETLTAYEMLGIALTIGGVAWVVTDRKNGSALPDPARRSYAIGILFGLGGALGQAGGMVVSKQGLHGDFSALSGNVMRLVAATTTIWLFTLARGQARRGLEVLHQHPGALRFIAGGAIVGPFLGVWLSLVAVQHAPVGIATTLTSLMPIFLLPLGRIVFKERITGRAVTGTVLAIVGIGVLFLHP